MSLSADEQDALKAAQELAGGLGKIEGAAKDAESALTRVEKAASRAGRALNTHGPARLASVKSRIAETMTPDQYQTLTPAQQRSIDTIRRRNVEKWNRAINHDAIGAVVNPPVQAGGFDPSRRKLLREHLRPSDELIAGIDAREAADRAAQARTARMARIPFESEEFARGVQRDAQQKRRIEEGWNRELAAERAARRNAMISRAVGGLTIAGAGVIAGNRFADALATETQSYAGAQGTAEREMRGLVNLDVDKQAEIRRQAFAQSVSMGNPLGEASQNLYKLFSDAAMLPDDQKKAILKSGLALERISESTAAENIGALIRVMSIYGDQITDVDQAAGKLQKTVDLGSVNMKDLATRLPGIAATFKAAGWGFDDSLAATAIGSSLGGRFEDVSTDVEILARRKNRWESEGLATPGAPFIQQMSELNAKNLSVPEKIRLVGEDAFALFEQILKAVPKLKDAATQLATVKPGDLQQRVGKYESDAFVRTARMSQRMDALNEATKKGLVVEGTDRSTVAAEGVQSKARDVGWMTVMPERQRALQEALGVTGLSKLAHNKMFEGVAGDTAAMAELETGRGDSASTRRAMEARIASGAFQIADANTDKRFAPFNRFNIPALAKWDYNRAKNGWAYRVTNQSDVDAWAQMRKESGWADMPWATFERATMLRESKSGDPQKFISEERARRTPKPPPWVGGRGVAAAYSFDALAPFKSLPAFKPALAEDKLNTSFLTAAEAAMQTRMKLSIAGDDPFAVDAAREALQGLRTRQAELSQDGMISATDRRTLMQELLAGETLTPADKARAFNTSLESSLVSDLGAARKSGDRAQIDAATKRLGSFKVRQSELGDNGFTEDDAITLAGEFGGPKGVPGTQAGGEGVVILREIAGTLREIRESLPGTNSSSNLPNPTTSGVLAGWPIGARPVRIPNASPLNG